MINVFAKLAAKLEEITPFARREDALQNPLVVVLRPRLHVGVTVAQAILAVVIGGGEGLVQDLEVVPFDENPLERGRYGPWHRPQRDGFVVARDQSQSPSRDGLGPPGASTGGPAISAVRFLRYGPSSTTCPAPRGGGPDTPPACRRSRGTRGCSRRALRPRRSSSSRRCSARRGRARGRRSPARRPGRPGSGSARAW